VEVGTDLHLWAFFFLCSAWELRVLSRLGLFC
jgi:hypothetical protein